MTGGKSNQTRSSAQSPRGSIAGPGPSPFGGEDRPSAADTRSHHTHTHRYKHDARKRAYADGHVLRTLLVLELGHGQLEEAVDEQLRAVPRETVQVLLLRLALGSVRARGMRKTVGRGNRRREASANAQFTAVASIQTIRNSKYAARGVKISSREKSMQERRQHRGQQQTIRPWHEACQGSKGTHPDEHSENEQ